MNKYKVLEPNKENPYQSVIQKTGVSVEFTIGELFDNIKSCKKNVVEIESKIGIEKATMKNIIQSHSALVELVMGQITMAEATEKMGKDYKFDEKDRVAFHLFDRSRRFVNEAEDKVLEFKTAIRDDERSMKEACDQCKIPMPIEAKFERAEDKKEKVDEIVNAPVKEEK